jgi:hypothetical protein
MTCLCVFAARRLWFTMRGGWNRYDVVITPMIAITVKLSATIEEFYGETVVFNIAMLLGVSGMALIVVCCLLTLAMFSVVRYRADCAVPHQDCQCACRFCCYHDRNRG